MKPRLLLSCLTAAFLAPGLPALSQTAGLPRIILDVDLCEDVDDAGALATLHALANRGEAEILGVLISSRNEWVVPCADAINTWYGRPDLPIGYQRGLQYGYRNTQNPDRETPSSYAEAVAKAFPHDLQRSSDAPDAALLARRLLAAQPDQSVTLVTVGFLTNLRDLLDSQPDDASPLDGEALVKQKVKQWVCMGGAFPNGRFSNGQGEYNFMWDTAASVRAINDWPTPIAFSGFAIGAVIKVGSRLAGTDEANPVRAAYQHYNGLTNREAWDQTAVLYAVRGASNYWKLSEPGLCLMHARVSHGFNEWIPSPQKQHRYLVEDMPPKQVGQVIEDLMIAPPRAGNPVVEGWYADPEAKDPACSAATANSTSCGPRVAGPARITPWRTPSGIPRSAPSSASAGFSSKIRRSRRAPATIPCCGFQAPTNGISSITAGLSGKPMRTIASPASTGWSSTSRASSSP